MEYNNHMISSIEITSLFGLYDYSLPEKGEISNACILYGDNGVGKSTVLRLAFHLLSASGNSGHRNELFNSIFKKLTVSLTSGYTLSAEITSKNDIKILALKIFKSDKLIAEWDCNPSVQRSLYVGHQEDFESYEELEDVLFESRFGSLINKKKRNTIKGKNIYMSTLSRIVPVTFILNADRRLSSDSISDPSDEVELRRMLRFKEPKDLNELVSRTREIAVSQALSRASKWFSRKAVQGTNQGADNVHSVYVKVLKHLVADQTVKKKHTTLDKLGLISRLDTVEKISKQLSEYELATSLDVSDFKSVLSTDNEHAYLITSDLLSTYIESLESRLEAVSSIYYILDKFVSIVNGLLTDKKIGFHLSNGFYIENMKKETLTTAQLSSGEQQLLLLFCYVIVARDQPSIFMIDEPEISLNIKWQRKLVQTLLDITDGGNVQFIFASHSMELLSQHRERVVVMTNQRGK